MTSEKSNYPRLGFSRIILVIGVTKKNSNYLERRNLSEIIKHFEFSKIIFVIIDGNIEYH